MQACCSRQTVAAAPRAAASRIGAGTVRTLCATAAARVPGIAAWRRFTQLLASIPDSNDDFGLV
ncbi:hypothetical protein DIE19_26790 [Burkholderia sp. Bp9126]|nr:hypothetical protein DIE19_26790 [Burkholderia sp. Bp9126]